MGKRNKTTDESEREEGRKEVAAFQRSYRTELKEKYDDLRKDRNHSSAMSEFKDHEKTALGTTRKNCEK